MHSVRHEKRVARRKAAQPRIPGVTEAGNRPPECRLPPRHAHILGKRRAVGGAGRSEVVAALRVKRLGVEQAAQSAQERIVAAQAADELLNIAGVTASLVIYPMGNGDVFISARSIGELNVQLVMEALGGGGSRSSAAVQLHDVSVAQAVQMARAAIDDNLEN